jgi:aminoglycoside 6'-N-acetyltransferase
MVSGDLESRPWISSCLQSDGDPFGYSSATSGSAWNTGWRPSQGTRGIDQFHRRAAHVDRGHGSASCAAYSTQVAAGRPDGHRSRPANPRAIRAYEKAGFERVRMVDTPDGIALLMVRNA